MTKKELELVNSILQRITHKTGEVELAISFVDRDLALRKKQSKDWKDIMYSLDSTF